MRRRPAPPSTLTDAQIVAAVDAEGVACLARLGVSQERYRQARRRVEWPARKRRLLAQVMAGAR